MTQHIQNGPMFALRLKKSEMNGWKQGMREGNITRSNSFFVYVKLFDRAYLTNSLTMCFPGRTPLNLFLLISFMCICHASVSIWF